ncbi:hypothetical protein Tco_0580492 [Tanacetum coccineum]
MTQLATTVDQQLTPVDRWLIGGPAVVDRWSATVDRRWPPLNGGPAAAPVTVTEQCLCHMAPLRWYDDEIPTKQVSQDIMEEVLLTIDEAKLRKMADEMLRQRCTSGDEHQYHIDQMKNFLKSDIVWESRKEILVSPHPRKTTPLVHSCQKDPEAPALSLINQDLLYQQKVNLTAPTMTFPGIKDHEMFSIIYEPVHGIIYKNSKKEKRVMRHSEIHKFCDAMLNRVLEGLKSYNNDIKYEYVQKDLTKDEAKYLKLLEERLKHRRLMRRWEMFMNKRPLGPRREHPE